jgi:transcriptional regulator with XRE-family HTH domain
MATSESGQPPLTLAEKLNLLFEIVPDVDGRPLTVQKVAKEVGCSVAYIHYLRRGERTNPTRDVLQALARSFGVSVDFLLDSDSHERVTEQLRRLKLLSQLRDAGALKVAARLGGLSDNSLQAVHALVEQLRHLEQLPDLPDAPDAQELT